MGPTSWVARLSREFPDWDIRETVTTDRTATRRWFATQGDITFDAASPSGLRRLLRAA